MSNTKIIKVLEPYGGWIDFSNKSINSELDTGFVNRLIHWRSAYLISKIHNFEFEIQVEDLMWPELKILDLPNTISVCKLDSHTTYSEYRRDFLNYGLTKSAIPIETKLVRDIILSKNTLLNQNYYYTNYPFNWDEDTDNNTLLKFPTIQFKYDFIETIIKKYVNKNYVGIHIRRGNGTELPILNGIYNQKYITNESDMNIVGWRVINKLDVNNTPYIPDSYYFDYMDKVISYNSDVKFFISYDIPYRFIKKFKDRYGDIITTSDDFLHEIEYQLANTNFKNELNSYKNVITNIIDLFSLSMCSSVIMNPRSSWSLFLKQYKNIKEPILKSSI